MVSDSSEVEKNPNLPLFFYCICLSSIVHGTWRPPVNNEKDITMTIHATTIKWKWKANKKQRFLHFIAIVIEIFQKELSIWQTTHNFTWIVVIEFHINKKFAFYDALIKQHTEWMNYSIAIVCYSALFEHV